MSVFRDDLVEPAIEALEQLGDGLDVDLSLDESGACFFEHDEGWRLALTLAGEDQIVAAVSVLSEVEAPSAETLASILTDMNWFGARTEGAALSWNPVSQSFVLWRSQDVETITATDLNVALLRLVRAAGAVRPVLQELLDGPAAPYAAAPAPRFGQRV